MYKHNSRFQQAVKFKGRRLSGYPKSRKLTATQSSVTGERQFETATVYIKQISPLVDQLVQARLSHASIAEQLQQKDIATPSGYSWTEALVAELIQTVRLSNSKYAKHPRRASRRPIRND